MKNLEQLAARVRRNGNVLLFSRQSSDLKSDAQRNLSGRTHYAGDDTLRFHHSRIVGANVEAAGLLYRIVEGVALDFQNTRRGFRFVIFDIFGTVISRCELEDAFSKSQKAFDASYAWLDAFDVAAHYRDTFATRAARLREEATFWEDCAASIGAGEEN